ncbi:MAG: DISARM system phospholipase D-like protein DrmC [Kiritimatiellae bacterium]|nr:DISARM system phospholipase D-like protein DrmC [Kiritimatiellia bacterium]
MGEGKKALVDGIALLGRELPCDSLDRMADALGAMQAGAVRRTAASALTSPDAREQVERFFDLWERDSPDTTPAEVALALRAAGQVDDYHRQRQTIEVVWTGPAPQGTTLRRTDQVLLDMIRNAKESLTIVSFAAYKVQHLKEALIEAVGRGVKVTFILESEKESGGMVSFDPLNALGSELASKAAVYVWPHDKREKDAHGHFGLLHAKCAIADRKALLVSSANLTEHALAINMELGLLIRGGDVPEKVAGHWEGLIESGTLVLSSPV